MTGGMLKLDRVTKVKVFLLVLVYVFDIDLFEFSAVILEKGLSRKTLCVQCYFNLLQVKMLNYKMK